MPAGDPGGHFGDTGGYGSFNQGGGGFQSGGSLSGGRGEYGLAGDRSFNSGNVGAYGKPSSSTSGPMMLPNTPIRRPPINPLTGQPIPQRPRVNPITGEPLPGNIDYYNPLSWDNSYSGIGWPNATYGGYDGGYADGMTPGSVNSVGGLAGRTSAATSSFAADPNAPTGIMTMMGQTPPIMDPSQLPQVNQPADNQGAAILQALARRSQSWQGQGNGMPRPQLRPSPRSTVGNVSNAPMQRMIEQRMAERAARRMA